MRSTLLTSIKKHIVLLLACTVLLMFTECRRNQKVLVNNDLFYTCSMHPQVMESRPGKCPVCSMELIPVQKSTAPKSDEIQLSDQQIQLGNISIDTIGRGVIGSETVLHATLNYDQQKLTSVSSRVMGRIDKLYHKNIGDYIRKGDALMEIYSEELNNAKQEYLLALERRRVLDNSLIDFDQVIKSAKTKLLLWGLSEAQVNAISTNKQSKLTTTVFSNEAGYITELNIQEGGYIAEGGVIVKLADLSTLWAEVQIYTSESSKVNNNTSVVVHLPETSKEIRGRIEFVNPEITPDKRINLVRVTVPNYGNQLKPGMSAYIVLKGGQKNVLSLPTDAVLRDGNGATVWVQTGRNIFKYKMVSVGMENDGRIEIISGLEPGEAVVTKGAYLVNSEFIFKKGANPMAGMKM